MKARFSLTVASYPNDEAIASLCELIYDSRDSKLIGSLSSVPYSVGRRFSDSEAHSLAEEMKKLKIGFNFRSESQGFADIVFDPNEELKSSVKPSIQTTKKSQRKILFFGGAVFAIGVIGALIFLKSQPETVPPALGQNDRARIEAVTKKVEYRRNRELLWSSVVVPLGLNNQDAIRTFEDSLATLRYREGTSLFIKPNTLVVIGNDGSETDKRVDLEDGTISARMIASKTPVKLSIRTKIGTLEMTSPSGSDKDSKFETSLRGEKLEVAVTSGELVLSPKDSSKPSVQLRTNQKIEATIDAVSQPQAFNKSLELLNPADATNLVLSPESSTGIRFEWENLGAGFDYEWSIATDPQMKNILLAQKVAIPFTSVQYLEAGDLYWQVRAISEDSEFSSKVYKLNVQNNNN